MLEALSVILRWLHITSAATLVGGFFYARMAAVPAGEVVSPESRERFAERAAAAFRPFSYAAIAGLLLSGLYTIFTTPGHTPRYHMLLGIKILLALHVFTAVQLIGKPGRAGRPRLMRGAFVSGLAIILISAYLRRIY